MTERILISGRRQTLYAADVARQALLSGRKLTRVAALLEFMIDQVVATMSRRVDRLVEELDRIEETMLTSSLTDEGKRLSRIRGATVRLHRHLFGLRSALRRIDERDDPSVTPALRLETGRLLHNIEGLDHDIQETRERALLLQEELALMHSEETNRNLKLLAIVTTVFLPPTLITGVYGMNVKDIPLTDMSGGFLWVSVLLAAAALGTVWILQRMGIFKR
jgi:zinc transporter